MVNLMQKPHISSSDPYYGHESGPSFAAGVSGSHLHPSHGQVADDDDDQAASAEVSADDEPPSQSSTPQLVIGSSGASGSGSSQSSTASNSPAHGAADVDQSMGMSRKKRNIDFYVYRQFC